MKIADKSALRARVTTKSNSQARETAPDSLVLSQDSDGSVKRAIGWGLAGAIGGALPAVGVMTNSLAIGHDRWLRKSELPIAAPLAAFGWIASTTCSIGSPVAFLAGRADIGLAMTAVSSVFGGVWWAMNGLNTPSHGN